MRLKLPNEEELADAHKAIQDEGRVSPRTVDLAMMMATSPTLLGVAGVIAEAAEVFAARSPVAEHGVHSVVVAAMMRGLHMGLYIGVAREETARGVAN